MTCSGIETGFGGLIRLTGSVIFYGFGLVGSTGFPGWTVFPNCPGCCPSGTGPRLISL